MKINNINFNMIGIIEFKEHEHSKNMRLLENIKHDVCMLLKSMTEDEMGERRYPVYDERRGRGSMRQGGHMYPKESSHYMREDYPYDESMDNRYKY